MPPPNRRSTGSQRYTLTVDGRSFSSAYRVEPPDHDVATGRLTPGGAKGDIVTVGIAAQGGVWTLTFPYDEDAYQFLKARKGVDGTLAGKRVEVGGAGRTIGRGDTMTGVVKGVTPGGLNTEGADADSMVVRFDADGVIG